MLSVSWQMAVDAASEALGVSKADIMAAIKQPLHPRELRDEFAMHAMAAYIAANPEASDPRIATLAYGTADAMLEARNANR